MSATYRIAAAESLAGVCPDDAIKPSLVTAHCPAESHHHQTRFARCRTALTYSTSVASVVIRHSQA